MEFNVGDKVRLKKEFYKERTFKLLEYYRKQSVGKLNGKELTIDAICRPDFCIKIGDTHVYVDLLEKVEKPVEKAAEPSIKVGDWVQATLMWLVVVGILTLMFYLKKEMLFLSIVTGFSLAHFILWIQKKLWSDYK